MTYEIHFDKQAEKKLLKLPKRVQERIVEKIDALAEDPRPDGYIKLKGKRENLYRIRDGNYRIVYSVKDNILVVLIVNIADRKEVY